MFLDKNFIIKDKYALYSCWIVRTFTAALLFSFIVYLIEISVSTGFSRAVSAQWIMSLKEYNAIDKSLIPASYFLVKAGIILFSSTLIFSFSALFFLFLLKKDYIYSLIVLLIILIQSYAAVNSFL